MNSKLIAGCIGVCVLLGVAGISRADSYDFNAASPISGTATTGGRGTEIDLSGMGYMYVSDLSRGSQPVPPATYEGSLSIHAFLKGDTGLFGTGMPPMGTAYINVTETVAGYTITEHESGMFMDLSGMGGYVVVNSAPAVAAAEAADVTGQPELEIAGLSSGTDPFSITPISANMTDIFGTNVTSVPLPQPALAASMLIGLAGTFHLYRRRSIAATK